MASGRLCPQPEADATNAQFKVESEKLRHNAITEMLLERRSVIVLGFFNGQFKIKVETEKSDLFLQQWISQKV